MRKSKAIEVAGEGIKLKGVDESGVKMGKRDKKRLGLEVYLDQSTT